MKQSSKQSNFKLRTKFTIIGCWSMFYSMLRLNRPFVTPDRLIAFVRVRNNVHLHEIDSISICRLCFTLQRRLKINQ